MHLLVLAEVPTFTVDIFQNPIAKNYRDVVGVPSPNQIVMAVIVPTMTPRHVVARLGAKIKRPNRNAMHITVATGAVVVAMVRLVGVALLLAL